MIAQTEWTKHITAPKPAERPAPKHESKRPHLVLEPDSFRANFAQSPFMVPHNLVGHPLFQLPRLVELARRLPKQYVEYNAGDVPISIDNRKTPHNGLSVEETVRRIEENRSWIVMKRIETDPEYGKLLNDCLDEIKPLSEPLVPGMYERAACVFVTSPNAITPYHMDHETNFLLQMRGSKSISVFDANDRSILAEEELEEYFSGPAIFRNMVFKDEYQAKAQVFDLKPGYALHIPSTFPHWVKNGPEFSISFSVAFFTTASKKRSYIYHYNYGMRRWGLRPRPVGQSPLRDSIKCGVYRTVWGAGRMIGIGRT